MAMLAGLDVGVERTAVCVIEAGSCGGAWWIRIRR